MKYLKVVMVVFALAFVAATFLPQARADEWNKKTIMTFSAPVELPGVVLPAGTYVFKLANSLADRNIVQVFNKDENRIYATILAIPDYRMEPTDKTVITFEERPKGTPEAIRAWFYPGSTYGEEFVYPKRRAIELAKSSRQHVPSMPAMMAKSVSNAPHAAQARAMEKAPITAVLPSGEEVMLSAVHPQQPSAPMPAPTTVRRLPQELPKTASPLPWLLLIGTMSLTVSLGLRFAARKSS